MILAMALLQATTVQSCRAQLSYLNRDSEVITPASPSDYLDAVPASGSSLSRLSVFSLDGACSEVIDGYFFDSVTLSNGRAFRVPENGGALEPFQILRKPAPPKAQMAPWLNGRKPAIVAHVGEPKKFIGVWRDGDRSVVAAFSEASTRPPTVIATTGRPVESLFYQSGPHEGFGAIDFISRGRQGTAKLVRYRWDHDGFRW